MCQAQGLACCCVVALTCCSFLRSLAQLPAVACPHASYAAGGSSLTIKVARSSQTEQQCVENTLAAIKAAVEKMPRKWEGLQVRCGGRSGELCIAGYAVLP